MAQYRATIAGQRGAASRLGSKKSGMVANINGWDLGVKVLASFIDGQDVFTVYLTGGSNFAHSPVELGTYTAEKLTELLHARPAAI